MSEPTLLDRLKNPFDPKFIKWRIGATNKDKTKGIALAYLDAREVEKRLDDVCGFDGWQDNLTQTDSGFVDDLSIYVNGSWVTKSDAAGFTTIEPVKGGASDAFKRAAAKWGVGRYLYYLPNQWVPIVQSGNSYSLAETPKLPKWALPNSDIANWEEEAEKMASADTSQGADENDPSDDIASLLDEFKSANTVEQIDVLLSGLDATRQKVFASVAKNRLEEIRKNAK